MTPCCRSRATWSGRALTLLGSLSSFFTACPLSSWTSTFSRSGPWWLASSRVPSGGTLTTVCPDTAGSMVISVLTGPICALV